MVGIKKRKVNKTKYKCHLCEDMYSKLNVLMSSHYNKAHTDIDKEEYKRGLLIQNGRSPKNCKICGKETRIAKGDAHYPDYHKECYLKFGLQGENNPNYKEGMETFNCKECKKEFEKYATMVLVNEPFCSPSCSQTFYGRSENHTPAIIEGNKKKSQISKDRWKDDKYRIKMANAVAKIQKEGSSKLEKNYADFLINAGLNIETQKVVHYYTFDILIDDEILVEVQGNYWHTLLKQQKKDRSKASFIANKDTYVLYPIWGNEIKTLIDQEELLTWFYKPVDLYLIIAKDCVFNFDHNVYNVIESIDELTLDDKPSIIICDNYDSKLVEQQIQSGIKIWTYSIEPDGRVVKPAHLQGRWQTVAELEEYFKIEPFKRYGKYKQK